MTNQPSFEQSLKTVQTFLQQRIDAGQNLVKTAHLKVLEESRELSEEPSLDEAADVVMCIIGVCMNNNWSLADLQSALDKKVAINMARTWCQMPDGTWHHVN